METRRLVTFYFQCTKTDFDFILSLTLDHPVMGAAGVVRGSLGSW